MHAVEFSQLLEFRIAYMKSPKSFPSLVAAAAAMMVGFFAFNAHGQCSADMNSDHQVNGTDLAELLSQWETDGTADLEIGRAHV